MNVGRLLAAEPALDRVRGVDARLHGDLGDPGEVVERHHVADREHLGMARQACSQAVRRSGRPGRRWPRWPRRAGPPTATPETPAAQIFVRHAIRSCRPVVRRDVDPEGVDAGDHRTRSGSSPPAARARSAAFWESRSPNAARISWPPSTSTTSASVGVDPPEVALAARSASSSAICPATSTPVGAAADDHEGQPRAADVRVLLASRPSRRHRRSGPAAPGHRRSSSSRGRTGRTRRDRSRTARRPRRRSGCRTRRCGRLVGPDGGHGAVRQVEARRPWPSPRVTLACRRRTSRIGGATSPSDRIPVASW